MTATSSCTSVCWFYRKKEGTDDDWLAFSRCDSIRLEATYQSTFSGFDGSSIADGEDGKGLKGKSVKNQSSIYPKLECDNDATDLVVSTNGGRYDVYIKSRIRKAIYWPEPESIVLRASWFYRPGSRLSYKPFGEEASEYLENAYQECLLTGKWSQKVFLPSGDSVVFHNTKFFAHYEVDHAPFSDDWSNITDNLTKPGKVWRGVQDLTFEDGEDEPVDHLVFVVHGIGEICDLRLRSLIEVVDDFRKLTNNLAKSHLSEETKPSGRIEFIPVLWHGALHGETTGVDSRLNLITLNGVPKLRHFSNDTILDALFYTSPIYCQIIIDTVGNELNRIHKLFLKRNPTFKGTISLMGHSLGSLIIFDILSNQRSSSKEKSDLNIVDMDTEETKVPLSMEEILTSLGLTEFIELFRKEKIDHEALINMGDHHFAQLELPMGPRIKLLKFIEDHHKSKTKSNKQSNSPHNMATIPGHTNLNYPQLSFHTACFFALGSPVAAFLTVRGVASLFDEKDFHLPTCDQVYNIFHPFDPIAYRLEPLIDVHFHQIPPCQIPHHKGRKRMHLELKENLIKMGSDLKEKVYNSLKPVWDSLYGLKRVRSLTAFGESSTVTPASVDLPSTSSSLSIDKIGEKEIDDEASVNAGGSENELMVTDDEETSEQSQIVNLSNVNHPCYKFNSSGRVDYVLQEAPIEFFNGYIFALATHTCYWQSEDTSLFVLRNIHRN